MIGSAPLMTGPWRVVRTSIVTSGWPLTLIVSRRVSKSAQPFGVRYCFALSGLMRSIYKSCTSGAVFVKPQAILSLRPRTTLGMPGSVAPITFRPGADRCAKYHNAGADNPRCGSFASSGLPLVVNAPDTAQLFDPFPSISEGGAILAMLVSCCAFPLSSRYKVV